jgi:anti-anti-sigma regulatory factor
VVALDMSAVFDVEYSALKMMYDGLSLSRERGVTFWLVGLNPEALEMVRRAGLDAQLGPERLLFDARTAIERFQRL